MRITNVVFPNATIPFLFKSMRMNTGGYLMSFAPSASLVHVFESLPQFHVGGASMDFGNSRMML